MHKRSTAPQKKRSPATETAATPTEVASRHRLLGLQRMAGNAAVVAQLAPAPAAVAAPPTAAPPPAGVAAVAKTAAEISALTLAQFDAYAQAQADWENQPGRNPATPAMTKDERSRLHNLLAFARTSVSGKSPVLSGCGGMLVSDLLASAMTPVAQHELLAYGNAVARTHVTVELVKVDDLTQARSYGRALLKLEPALGPGVCHVIFDQANVDRLKNLIDSGFVDDFITFKKVCSPVLEAPGAEIASYLALRSEGADPVHYHGRLPDVRNFHRFEKRALDQLVVNRGDHSRKRPLFLILHSALDHNGAFHRDPNLTAVIVDGRHLSILVEGKQSLSEMGSELGPLAHSYGVHGKIEQVMIAGHGNSNVIQLTGTVDGRALSADPNASADSAERGQDLSSAPGATKETDKFMRQLLANMASDPGARIVLNGCLTASNSVDKPLDSDPAKAAAQVHGAITAEPSLASYLQAAAKRAGSSVDVKGANASFGQVGLMDASGNLDIVAAGGADPKLTASKLDYIGGGTEPEGAMRAVLEVWSSDRLATPPGTSALDAVRHRVASEAVSKDWNARLIQTAYGIVGANPDNAELMRQLASGAGSISEALDEAECRVAALSRVPAGQLATLFTGQEATAQWLAQPRIRLVFLEKWMLLPDASKQVAFLDELGAGFTSATAQRFVDFGAISGLLPALLPETHAASPKPGQLILAALGVGQGPVDPTCKKFLLAVIGKGSTFPAALGLNALLGGFATITDIETALGLHGSAPVTPPGGGGPGAPPDNVDLNGDGTNDFHVDSMTRTGGVTATALNVRARPGLNEAVVGTKPRGATVNVIGSSGDWYAITHQGGTAFVFKRFVRLTV